MQTLRVIDAQSAAITSSFQIIAEGGAQNSVAQILQAEIDALISGTVTIHPLSALDDNASQIVIGDTTNATIDSLAAAHKRSTRNLGPEGYNLIALPNPGSTNGSWRILIVANSREGLIHGVFTLSDLIAGGTPGSVDNVRVRDYPDRPLRDLQHWVRKVTGEAWVSARTQEFRDMASYGANSVSLGRSDFYRMDRSVSTGTFGSFLKQTVDAARNYGVEPNTEITFPTPDVGLFPDGWKWREGEFVQDEPFVIVDSLGALVLRPVHPNFNNVAHNMSFDSLDASGWPARWIDVDGLWGDPSGWNLITLGGDVQVKMTGVGISSKTARLKQVLYTKGSGTLEPASLYVLKGTFSNVVSAGATIEIEIWGNSSIACPDTTLQTLDAGTYGPNAVSLVPPMLGAQSWEWHRASFPIQDSTTQYTEYFYFWTPPDRAHAPDTSYSCPFFEDLDNITLQIYVGGISPSETVTIHGLSLERRASTLSNVMYLPTSSVPDGTDPLDFTVRLADGTPVPSSAYTVAYHRPADYRMESPDSITTVYWQDTQVADSGSTVLASFTVGVPDDWMGGEQATTYCFRSPGFLGWIDTLLQDLYVDTTQYAFNPKYLTVRLDEKRGMNRCGRDVAANRTNADYLVDYILRVQSILDSLAAEGYTAAGQAKLILYADMYPANVGVLEDYQFRYGGPWGAMEAGPIELDRLAASNANLIFDTSFEYANLFRPGWPRVPPYPNISVAGRMIYDSTSTSTHYQYPETASDSTWYENDCVGFLVANNYYNKGTIHTQAEYRLLDYAWKRYRNPDVSLIARKNGFYVTDDAVGDTATVFPTDSLEFEYFASPEVRDPANADTLLASATIDWGDGSPVASVFDPSDPTRVQGSVSHAWFYGDHIVTLSVTTQGGASRSVTIPVHVDIYGDPNTTVWSTDTTISDTVRVEVGKVLIIAPGTNVTAGPIPSGFVRVFVFGTLGIMGTATNPVTFAYTDTTKFDGWTGILVTDSASAVIDHCDYRNAAGGIGCRGKLTIRNSTIRDCSRLGLAIAGADSVYARNVTIRNIPPGYDGLSIGINLLGTARLRADSCVVEDATTGLLGYQNSQAYVYDTVFRRSISEGIQSSDSASVWVSGCTITGGSYDGLMVMGNGTATVEVDHTSFDGNAGNGIEVYMSGVLSAADCAADSNGTGLRVWGGATVTATRSTFAHGQYGVYATGSAVSASIDSCTMDQNETGIYVTGTPNVTIANSTISGSTNEGIYVLAGSNGAITGNTISGGTVGIKADASHPTITTNTIQNSGAGIYCDAASPLLKRNRLSNNTNGLMTLNGADPTLQFCSASPECPPCADANSITGGSGYRVSNLDVTVTIQAECNYWGATTGKGAVGPSMFIGPVDYDPMLNSSPLLAPPAPPGRPRFPTRYALQPGYPNPFNPTLTVPYEVPPPGGKVSIRVYNVKGQLVTTLVDGPTNPGYRSVVWEGTGRRGNPVSSGVYFVQMLGPKFEQTRKVVLLK